MLIEDFNTHMAQLIGATGTEYSPFTGYPFRALPFPTFQVLASREFDLVPGVSVKGADGKDYMIVDTHWFRAGIGCLVTLIPESAVATQEAP